ncbi:MAG: hypothetical protein RLZZ324_1280 [Candidatus Parcubacteria bacterium]|jgi:hypothetical protein
MYTAQDFWDRILLNPTFTNQVGPGPYRDLHRDVVFAAEPILRPYLALIATTDSVGAFMRDSLRFLLDAGWIDRLSEAEAKIAQPQWDAAAIQTYVDGQRLVYESMYVDCFESCRVMGLVNDPSASQADRDEGAYCIQDITEFVSRGLDPQEITKFGLGLMTIEAWAYKVVGTC